MNQNTILDNGPVSYSLPLMATTITAYNIAVIAMKTDIAYFVGESNLVVEKHVVSQKVSDATHPLSSELIHVFGTKW